MQLQHATHKGIEGFTLIELSIVLVIIALIVGGILVGQDLIRAAELRATVSQIEKYNAGINTFRLKYQGIPGDLNSVDAAAYGFVARAGSSGRGNGDGLINGTGAGDNNECFTQESGMLWNDLSTANLVDGSFTGAQNTDAASPNAVTAAQVPTTFPPAKLGRGNYVTDGSSLTGGSNNYWLIAGIGGVTGGAGNGGYSVTANITPSEAYNIDIKLDNGMPYTGTVQARGYISIGGTLFRDGTSWAASSTQGNCLMGGASGTDPAAIYNRTSSTGGNSPACMLRFRFN